VNPNVLTAVITTAGSMAIAITALVLNYSSFRALSGHMGSIERRLDSIERRLETIEADLKHFYRDLSDHAIEIARLKDKAGLN
jgi:hypothetical protein